MCPLKEPDFGFVGFCYGLFCFVSFAFISALIFKISFLLLTMRLFIFPFLVPLGVELGYLTFFLFLKLCLYCYEPSPYHCFYRFWVVVFSFSFISMHILISFFISSVICWLFSSMLFSLHMLEFLIVFLL